MSGEISKTLNGAAGAANVKTELGPQHAKLKKATEEFEAVFLGMMLKTMRKSMTSSNGLLGNSSESKMYQEMMDETTANQMSKSGSFGLAKTLYASMERTLPKEDAAPTVVPVSNPVQLSRNTDIIQNLKSKIEKSGLVGGDK